MGWGAWVPGRTHPCLPHCTVCSRQGWGREPVHSRHRPCVCALGTQHLHPPPLQPLGREGRPRRATFCTSGSPRPQPWSCTYSVTAASYTSFKIFPTAPLSVSPPSTEGKTEVYREEPHPTVRWLAGDRPHLGSRPRAGESPWSPPPSHTGFKVAPHDLTVWAEASSTGWEQRAGDVYFISLCHQLVGCPQLCNVAGAGEQHGAWVTPAPGSCGGPKPIHTHLGSRGTEPQR